MRASVRFRHRGETIYRTLGSQEMNARPALGDMVTVDVDGKPARALVVECYEFLPDEPSLYLESV